MWVEVWLSVGRVYGVSVEGMSGGKERYGGGCGRVYGVSGEVC